MERVLEIGEKQIFQNPKEIIEAMCEVVDIDKIYLFGSYARGDYNDDSDLDFYIILNDDVNIDNFTDRIQIKKKIINTLYNKKIYKTMDILLSNFQKYTESKNINNSIEFYVEKEGMLIYERNLSC